MCGFAYDDRYFRRPSLDKYNSYQKNHRKGETEDEYFKRIKKERKK